MTSYKLEMRIWFSSDIRHKHNAHTYWVLDMCLFFQAVRHVTLSFSYIVTLKCVHSASHAPTNVV